MEKDVGLGRRVTGDEVRRGIFSARQGRAASNGFAKWLALLLGIVVLIGGSFALAAKYVYDDNGRLVVTVNEQSGESARYVYDKVGNLLRIERLAAGQVAIFTFLPARGGIGVPVRIEGQGFGATPAENIVRFNGTAATVTRAATTELDVLVPAGASTGPLTVTVGSQTATGPSDFVIDESAQPPVITGISPLIGHSGTAVTVAGSRLYPAPDLTRVLLGSRVAVPSSTSDTQLVFSVPLRAGSGGVTVSTPYGSAQSAEEFVVLPGEVNAADVVNAGRLSPDVQRTLSTTAANQQIALLLDPTAKDLTSLQFGGLSTVPMAYALYGPDNRNLASGNVSVTQPSVHLPRLSAGVHLLLLKPVEPSSWSLVWENNSLLGPQSESSTVTTVTPYQSKRLLLNVAAGDNLGIGVHDLVTPGSTRSIRTTVFRSDGSQLAYELCFAENDGCDLNLPLLTMPGQYSVVFEPASDGARTYSLKTSLSADQAVALVPDAIVPLSLGRRGENGRLTFAAQAGQTLAFNASSQVTSPVNRDVYYTVYKPDGSVLQQGSTKTGLTQNMPKLPVGGNYWIYVDPNYGETYSAQVVLVSGQSGELTSGLQSVDFATQAPSQNVYFNFVAGQAANLGLGISDLVTPDSGGAVGVYVYRPDGSQLTYEYCYADQTGCDVNLANLVAGTYSVMVTPPSTGARTLAFKATLSADEVLPLSLDVSSAVTLARRGQNARLTFTAQAGQTLAFNVAGQSTQPAGRDVYYTAYKPDGTVLQQGNTVAGLTLNLANLPSTGTYQVFMDPGRGETASAQVKLVPGQVGGPDPGGSLGNFDTQAPGQNVYFNFVAEQGANLGLGISDLVTPGTIAFATVYVYLPNGSQLTNKQCSAESNGCDLDLAIPETGTYSVTVTPPATGNRTMAFKATLSTDQVRSLAINAPVNLELIRRGENARLKFAGVVGQTVAFNVSGQTTGPAGRNVYYTVYKPDGTTLQQSSTTTGLTMNLFELPANGEYSVFVDPEKGETLSSQVALLSGEVGALELGAEPRSFATMASKQDAYLTFNAQQGADLGLGISDLATPGSTSSVSVTVFGPNGAQISHKTCYAVDDSCELDLWDLAAGKHTVTLVSLGNGTMSFKATLSPDAVHTLTPNSPLNLALARRGENARLMFMANAGQTFALGIAGQSTSPVNRTVTYTAYRPDGTVLQQRSGAADVTMNLNDLPVSGQYMVFVDSNRGEALAAKVTLIPGEVQSVSPGGDPVSFLTQASQQEAYILFDAQQGADLGLGISDLATPGSTSSVSVTVYGPNGAQISTKSCYAVDGSCELDLWDLAAGRHKVKLVSIGNGAMSFNATLSPDAVHELAPNSPLNFTLARRGENARLLFTATAGQTFAFNASGQATDPISREVYYTVYKPDGTVLQQRPSSADLTMNFYDLPVSGQYMAFVDPNRGETLTAKATLISGEVRSVSPGGASIDFLTQVSQQEAYILFNTQQGADLGLGISDLATPGSTSSVSVTVYGPSGAQISTKSCYAVDGSCELDLWDLAAGNHMAKLAGVGKGAMSFKATLSPDAVYTLTPNTPLSLALARPGENGRLMFTATAGQTFALNVSGLTTNPSSREVSYTVYKPDGAVLRQLRTIGNLTMNLTDLPVGGDYMVFVDSSRGETLGGQVTLASGAIGVVETGAEPKNFATQVPGQEAYFNFTVGAGANLGIGLSDLLTPGAPYPANVYVYGPTGSQVSSKACAASDGGCEIDLWNLAAGNYSAKVVPHANASSMSFKVSISADSVVTSPLGTPLNFAVERRGQNGRFKFTSTAGQSFTFVISGQSTNPAGRDVYYTLYKPDGTMSQQRNTKTGLTMSFPNLPVAGEYMVFIDPMYGETVSTQLSLSSP
ncbi:IPT/TIG domain-containing protein [Lysobacter sp. CA196]|uniref:IPT/TIG domain-containing protein n=1 Tax=Lysobacter sp. CA196 TaxID=3455606 RepID=UPI003F8D5866